MTIYLFSSDFFTPFVEMFLLYNKQNINIYIKFTGRKKCFVSEEVENI